MQYSLRNLGFLVVIAGLFSCTPELERAVTDAPSTSVLRPKAGKGITMSKPNNESAEAGPGFDEALEAQIPLPQGMVRHGYLEVNLDDDEENEWLLTCKKQNDPADLIYLVVADRAPGGSQWTVPWQTATAATNLKTFSLSFLDVLGKHHDSLLAFGTTKEGSQTLLIVDFPATASTPQGTSILQTIADTEISVNIVPRTASYEEQGLPAPPFTIQVMEKSNLNPNDLNKTSYIWNQALNRYVPGATEVVRGTTIREEQLAQIFSMNVAGIESHLDGPWVRTVSSAIGNTRQVVFFDSVKRQIRLIEGDRLEGYEWTVSHHVPGSSRVHAYASNETFKAIKSVLAIQLVSNDALQVTISDRIDWEGTFKRMNQGDLAETGGKTYRPVPLHSVLLSGLYKGERQSEIVFSGQSFTMRQGTSESTGSYVTYSLDNPILSLAFINERNSIVEVKNYQVTIKESIEENKVNRVLELLPVRLYLSGAIPVGTEPERYLQTEER